MQATITPNGVSGNLIQQLRGRDFIDLRKFDREQINALLDLALEFKSGKERRQYLKGKHLGMLFEVPSTRTRISFQVGAGHLGGHAEYYNTADLQLSNREELRDTAAVMSRYLDALIVRMYDMTQYNKGREALETLAQSADVPVINALDDKDHPCQTMADLLTLREKYDDNYLRKKVVMAWGSLTKNMCHLHKML